MYDRITGWLWCQLDTQADRFGVATNSEKIENRSVTVFCVKQSGRYCEANFRKAESCKIA